MLSCSGMWISVVVMEPLSVLVHLTSAHTSCDWAQIWAWTPRAAVVMWRPGRSGLEGSAQRGAAEPLYSLHPVEQHELIRGNKLLHERGSFPVRSYLRLCRSVSSAQTTVLMIQSSKYDFVHDNQSSLFVHLWTTERHRSDRNNRCSFIQSCVPVSFYYHWDTSLDWTLYFLFSFQFKCVILWCCCDLRWLSSRSGIWSTHKM